MYFYLKSFVALLLLILFLVAIILLQIILSKRENKWPGLIIPIISFGLSMLWIMGIPYYLSLSGLILKVVLVFIITNIPTAFFLAIYFNYRKKKTKIDEIYKMNIQDLE